eukprot:6200537-Pleurochrysis_carterae.AAC.1
MAAMLTVLCEKVFLLHWRIAQNSKWCQPARSVDGRLTAKQLLQYKIYFAGSQRSFSARRVMVYIASRYTIDISHHGCAIVCAIGNQILKSEMQELTGKTALSSVNGQLSINCIHSNGSCAVGRAWTVGVIHKKWPTVISAALARSPQRPT